MNYDQTVHHPTELKHEGRSFQLSRTLKKKIIISVLLAHFLLIVLPYLTSLIARWLKPPRPKGMVVKLLDGLPGNPGKPAPSNPTPAPIPEPPAPQPTPVPQPVIRPEPTIKSISIKPPPKEPKININKIRKITIKRPKPKPEPQLTPLTPQQLSKINEAKNNDIYKPQGKEADQTGTITDPGNRGGAADNNSYFDSVGAYLYSRWRHPSKTELGNRMPSVTISVSIDANGRILSARILNASGIRPMDNSVQELLSSLTSLPKPPDGPMSFDIELVVEDE